MQLFEAPLEKVRAGTKGAFWAKNPNSDKDLTVTGVGGHFSINHRQIFEYRCILGFYGFPSAIGEQMNLPVESLGFGCQNGVCAMVPPNPLSSWQTSVLYPMPFMMMKGLNAEIISSVPSIMVMVNMTACPP